jgi:nucleoside-diphosphate-sugar epimerase
LWTYIDVRDAALACRLSVETTFSGHEPFNICAPNTITTYPTTELAKEYFPGVTLRGPLKGNWSGMTARKLTRSLVSPPGICLKTNRLTATT